MTDYRIDPKPLVTLIQVGTRERAPGEVGGSSVPIFGVVCTEHGNITRFESGGTVNDAPLIQADLYARRHLSRHLKALAAEIDNFNR